ncbi:MAG: diheme cytochrome c [Gammaproteobacteria bacterium]
MNTSNTPAQFVSVSATATLCLLAIGTPLAAHADGTTTRAPEHPAWQEECGSCHIAYPPRFLPAESWRQVMGSLDDHFGTDASIDTGTAATIQAFLVQNAKRSKTDSKATGTPIRITETTWFRSEHDDIATAKWKSAAINSATNCGACHHGADKGTFRERDIKVP